MNWAGMWNVPDIVAEDGSRQRFNWLTGTWEPVVAGPNVEPLWDRKKYPHDCPCCGKPAYIGIMAASKPDCAANCNASKIWPRKE